MKSNKIWHSFFSFLILFHISLSSLRRYSSKVIERSSRATKCFIYPVICSDFVLSAQDIRRTIPGNLRPLMTNIPASSMYSVRSGHTRSRTVSVSDSPLATSSNASSEVSVNNNGLCLDGIELEDDIGSGRGGRSPLRGRWCSELNIWVMNSHSNHHVYSSGSSTSLTLKRGTYFQGKKKRKGKNWPEPSFYVWCKVC
jgi:hypothetical protein